MNKLLTFLTLAFVLGLAGVASAAFRTGTYKATTTQGGKLTLKVSATKVAVKSIQVAWTCTDGDRFSSTLTNFPPQNNVAGRYDATFTGSGGASRYRSWGRVVNSKAYGRFTGRRTYDTSDKLDPNGSVVCLTGTIRYTARRVVARR